MSLKTLSTWRRRAVLAVVATPGILFALVFSLAFSALPALAATTTLSTDPFT